MPGIFMARQSQRLLCGRQVGGAGGGLGILVDLGARNRPGSCWAWLAEPSSGLQEFQGSFLGCLGVFSKLSLAKANRDSLPPPTHFSDLLSVLAAGTRY